MEKKEFYRLFLTVSTSAVIYSAICEAVIWAVWGFSPAAMIGVVVGTAVMLFNFSLMGYVSKLYISGNPIAAILIYLLRILIYGISVFIIYQKSADAAIASAAGVLGVVPGGLVYFLKEGKKNGY